MDDTESIRAIQRAVDLGVNFFDTADAYGCGHSEEILDQALDGHRDEVVIATKFGGVFDEKTKDWLGHSHPNGIVSPEYIRKACESSLQRLKTDYIDLYQFHWLDYNPDLASNLLPVLDDLVKENKIRYYGWSTPDPKRAHVFAEVHTAQHFNTITIFSNVIQICWLFV